VNRKAIIEKVKGFPATPGVYLFKDDRGRVLYVGKSVSLCDRVMSYFRGGEAARQNINIMMDKVEDVDFVETASEVDALLSEQRLVKDLKPRYNVDLKDDKSYPVLEIRRREEFPRVAVTRDPARGSKVYGPFIDADGLRAAFALLQRVFKFRVCSLEIGRDDSKRRFYRPCLYYHIGSCLAPCAAKVTHPEYREAVRRLCQFLDGRRLAVVRGLKGQMEKAAKALDFEKAAGFRDQMQALESLSKRGLFGGPAHVGAFDFDPARAVEAVGKALGMEEPPRMMEAVDIANIQGKDSVGSIVTFIDGRPFKDGYRRYKIKAVRGQDDYAMIAEVIYRRYARLKDEEAILPHLLLVDGGPGQLSAAVEALAAAGARPAQVASLAKREELVFIEGRDEPIEMPRTSAGLKVLQALRDEAHRFAQAYHHLLRDKELFGANAARVAKSARTTARTRRRKRGSERI